MMIDSLAAIVALIIPLYIGYGAFYYKLGKIEGKVDQLNGYSKKKQRR